MAQPQPQKLDSGDAFPRLAPMRTLAHGPLELPAALAGKWGVILFYRGHW
ncbi:MAG TPA: hypothetical protein VLB72_01980 [Burkholderiales bacterium]|nr:hypothetical protein [Burkholderiales bacterium]